MEYWSTATAEDPWLLVLPLLHYSIIPTSQYSRIPESQNSSIPESPSYFPYSFLAISANLNFCTFPERVMGNSLTNLK